MDRGLRLAAITAFSVLVCLAGCRGQITTSEKSPKGGG